MQIATLSYQYDPKENVNGDSQAKLRHRRVLTTITNPQRKYKQRQSLLTTHSTHSNVPLPPIKTSRKRPNSIRIKGSSLTAPSKLGESSAYSLHPPSRSQSRQSNKSELSAARSNSVTPGGPIRSTSRLIRLKFGYPIKIRSADFYGPNQSIADLHLREESFVNDSVRCAHQSRRSSIIPYYEALDDPHLRQFFQSPVVLDIVRKTLNADPDNSFKQDETSSKTSKIKKGLKSSLSYENLFDDYHRIVTKGSSGYAKLNGYDCIPSYAPARYYRRRSSTVDPTPSHSQRRNTLESRLHRSTTQDKYQASANTSLTSFPTNNSNPQQQQDEQQQKKKKSRKYEKYKQPKPVTTSSPLRQLVEQTTSNIELASTTTTKTDGNVADQKSELATASNVSQD